VIADVAHELIHAFDDCESGHQGFFAHVARYIGLEGKLTQTHAGDELRADLQELVDMLGDYPHHRMDVTQIKKDSTRQLKVECKDCGCIFRTSKKWMDRVENCPVCKSPNITKS
jgi:predicted Zn-ribbon and HTH transcriptional regulator